jgi:hypothetical protein
MWFSQQRLARYVLLLHVMGWVTFVTLPFLFFPWNLSFWERPEIIRILPAKLLSDAVLIGFFYLNLQELTPRSIKKQTLWPVSIGALLCLGLLMLTNGPLMPDSMPPMMPGPPLPAGMPQPAPMPLSMSLLPLPQLLSFVLVVSVSSGLALWRDLVRTREMQQQMSLEKVTAELAMLKLQISPHFLFNTLNNIRWLTGESAEVAEEAIIKLSQLLRYILYQAHQDRVPLEQEIIHLQNYIDLQKMRLVDPDSVQFSWEGPTQDKSIVPLLLIPFVENAFKHGQHGQYRFLIRIDLRVRANTLVFRTENPYFADQAESTNPDSGIGIQNVQRRLNLHYPNHHQLTLDQHSGLYSVELRLALS